MGKADCYPNSLPNRNTGLSTRKGKTEREIPREIVFADNIIFESFVFCDQDEKCYIQNSLHQPTLSIDMHTIWYG